MGVRAARMEEKKKTGGRRGVSYFYEAPCQSSGSDFQIHAMSDHGERFGKIGATELLLRACGALGPG